MSRYTFYSFVYLVLVGGSVGLGVFFLSDNYKAASFLGFAAAVAMDGVYGALMTVVRNSAKP